MDHAFDVPLCRGLAGRKNEGHVATNRNAIMKGVYRVRFKKAKTNYSKVLPTKRMGIDWKYIVHIYIFNLYRIDG